MLSWAVRLVLIAAGGIVGLFIAEDTPRFGIYQAMVSLLLVVLVVFVVAFWPQRWSHFLDRFHRESED
ncbi:MAG TPA: hypothetical protein VMA30_16205 [Xanthobacteraceae bacterium]|nr:hypothetical protein [Xanthobacteraceae bacterium]